MCLCDCCVRVNDGDDDYKRNRSLDEGSNSNGAILLARLARSYRRRNEDFRGNIGYLLEDKATAVIPGRLLLTSLEKFPVESSC